MGEFGYALTLSSSTSNYLLNLLGQMYVWQGLFKNVVS
jgi:predicted solute-binding protein